MNTKVIKGYEPKVFIEIKALNKMNEYIRQSNDEIGWLGTATKKNNNYTIHDVFLFEQEVHSTTTEITVEGLNNFSMEILKEHDGINIWNNMKLWGHSHVNMSTSPSGQDDKQMEIFTQNANDFFIRIIGNKKGSMKIDIWDYDKGIIYENLEYSINFGSEQISIDMLKKEIRNLQNIIEEKTKIKKEDVDFISKEIKAKVKKKANTFTNNWNKNWNGNSWKNNNKNTYDSYDYCYGSYWYNDYDEIQEEDEIWDYFNVLDQEETFEMKYLKDHFGGIKNAISKEDLKLFSKEQLETLSGLIDDYCLEFEDEYVEYLSGMSVEV